MMMKLKTTLAIISILVNTVVGVENSKVTRMDEFHDPEEVSTFDKYRAKLYKRWITRKKHLDPAGKHFRVIVEEVHPYIMISKSKNGTSITGYIGDIWNILQQELKFTSSYYELNITQGKAAMKNGTYDIMLNPITLSSQDIDDLDHSMPIMSSWYELFMRLKEGQGSSSSYILAWSRDLWLAFVGTLIVITVLMWSISSFRRFCGIEKCDSSNGGDFKKTPNKTERTNHLSFSCCLLFVLGAVTQRGFGLRESPTATPLHIVAVLSLLFGLLMQTSYSAALVSRLAVRKTEQGFEELTDISAKKTHSLCIRVENFAYAALFLGKDGELAPEWKKIVNAPPCVAVPIKDQDIRETICSKQAITLDSTTVMARIMRVSLPCFITKLKGRYAVFYVPLLMRKGFPYNRLISSYLLRLQTSGVIQRLQTVWVHKTLDLPVPLHELGVTMSHIDKILWLYAVANIISLMLLSLEIVHYHIHQEDDE